MAKALLIIDFQNDFTSGGALAVPDGDEIAEPVKRLADRFELSSQPGTGTRPTTRPSRPRAARGRFTACRAPAAPNFTRRWSTFALSAASTSVAAERTRAIQASRSPIWPGSSPSTT